MNNRRGFTITELCVACGIAAMLTAIFVGYYKTGFSREYQLSQAARNLAASLNATRMKAFEGRMAVELMTSNCTAWDTLVNGEKWDKEWSFTAKSELPSGLNNTDYVTFSNLDVVSMNGGILQVFDVTETENTGQKLFYLTFKANFYQSEKMLTQAGIPLSSTYGSGGKTPAFAKNQKRAAELIVRRYSQVDHSDDRFSREPYYVYDDQVISGGQPRIIITESTDPMNKDTGGNLRIDKVTAFYNASGLPSNEAGYSFAISYVPNGFYVGSPTSGANRTKIVTVTPVGRTVVRDEK